MRSVPVRRWACQRAWTGEQRAWALRSGCASAVGGVVGLGGRGWRVGRRRRLGRARSGRRGGLSRCGGGGVGRRGRLRSRCGGGFGGGRRYDRRALHKLGRRPGHEFSRHFQYVLGVRPVPGVPAYMGGYEVAGRGENEHGRRRDSVPEQVVDVPRAGDGGGGVVQHRVGEFVPLYHLLGLRPAIDADGDYLEVEGLELPVPFLQLDELPVANPSEIAPIKNDDDRLLADVVGAVKFATASLGQCELGEAGRVVALN